MGCKVLIIDDDVAFKRLVELRLKSFLSDLEMVHYQNLGDARRALAETPDHHYDLVVLDEHLPDGKGVELLKDNLFQDVAVLCVSSDHDPELPGRTILAGANYFLNKLHVSEPLFRPLVEGIVDRNRIHRELMRIKTQAAVMDSVRTLLMTLRHEINNPLGAVLGAAYLLGKAESATPEQRQAAALVESSGQRIKHVLEQLGNAVSLESVTKANTKVYHIPGDQPWDETTKKKRTVEEEDT